jgi:hypothetical protein
MANVTPGFTWTSTTPITAAALNLTAQPIVTIGSNEVVLSMMATLAGPNYLLGRYTTAAGNVEAIDLTTQGLGFYTGAGGTVTQATSKATAFTLSKMCGQITTAGDILNAAIPRSRRRTPSSSTISLEERSGHIRSTWRALLVLRR